MQNKKIAYHVHLPQRASPTKDVFEDKCPLFASDMHTSFALPGKSKFRSLEMLGAEKKLSEPKNSDLSIVEFYNKKSIFVTGGTGFIGKVLIEKLLRSCPGIKNIYVLMRPKKGNTIEERLAQLLALPLYDRLRTENASYLDKVIPVRGDTSERDLGLSPKDRRMLVDNVDVVFHSAASVRFDDPLRKAILVNVRGALEVVKLAQDMKNLRSFVHVSTTYCNTHVEVVEEKIYPPADDWRKLIKLAENMDEDGMEVFCRKIIGLHPNTYTYTKALAEQVIHDHQDSISMSIMRPSIVVNSYLEPIPGWIDNFNGPIGLLVGRGKGIIRITYALEHMKLDYMPVDIAVKIMILQAWDTANTRKLMVFNCSSHEIFDLTHGDVTRAFNKLYKEIPFNDIVWTPKGSDTSSKFYYYICFVLLHLIPAAIIDAAMKLANRPTILLRIQRKVFYSNMALERFLTNEWAFKNSNSKRLLEKVPEFERSTFPPILRDFDPEKFIPVMNLGMRQYLLKEDNSSLPEAKKQFERMYWIDKVTKFAFLALISYMVFTIAQNTFLE